MSVALNSFNRVFIQESPCSPYKYSENGGIQFAGVSESFGDVSYLYKESDYAAGTYDVVAQIEGAQGTPTTTITTYLPENGKSQLLELARRKCSFNLQLHYGRCNNPTDFNDFEWGYDMKDVKITGYSTTDLTSRSPDTRSAIDLTFNVSMSSIMDIRKAGFIAGASATQFNGGILDSIFVHNESNCGQSNCRDNAVILGINRASNLLRFVRKIDGTWYSSIILSGVTHLGPTSDRKSWIYTDGKIIYAAINTSSTPTWRLYKTDYANIRNSEISWTLVSESWAGSLSPRFYAHGPYLYFTEGFGSSNRLIQLTVSDGTMKSYTMPTASVPDGVWGYNDTVYVTCLDGAFYKFKNGTLSYISNFSPGIGTLPFQIVSISSEDRFVALTNKNSIACTSNGGQTWTYGASVSTPLNISQLNKENPQYVVAMPTTGPGVFESFDGGLSWTKNSSSGDIFSTTVSWSGNEPYIGGALDEAYVRGSILVPNS